MVGYARSAGALGTRATVLFLAALALMAGAAPASAQLTINEVLYDPDGADSGAEWIEVHNAGPWPVRLEDVTLEFGNGSSPGSWVQLWVGSESDWIDSGSLFWIGGPFAGRPPDAETDLGLQNGPDAVRLSRLGVVLDLLGWGELTRTDAFEGEPAMPVGSGVSLGRHTDGFDSQNNLRDFTALPPSPGRLNRPVVDAALRRARGQRALPLTSSEGQHEVSLVLENRGQAPIHRDQLEFWVRGLRREPPFPLQVFPLSYGEEVHGTLRVSGPFALGAQTWSFRLRLTDDQNPDNDTDSLQVWVGPPPIRWNELYPRPQSGEGEWLELATQADEVDLDGWSISDADDHRIILSSTQPIMRAGTAVVVAPEETTLPANVVRLSYSGSWPSLNDGASGAAVADSLFLIDPSGRIVDWCVYGNAPRGIAWIRQTPPDDGQAIWTPDHDHPGGTPGRILAQPPTRGPGDSGFAPPRLSIERFPGGAWILLPAASFPGAYRVQVFDLAGRLHWSTSGRVTAPRQHWCLWPGHDQNRRTLPCGLYVVRAEIESADGYLMVDHESLAVTP